MRHLLLGLAGPLAVGLVLGAAITWDRLREPHRDPRGAFAVVDQPTLNDALRRFTRLVDAGDLFRARVIAKQACLWLRHEIHTGPKRKRVRRAAELEQWELLESEVSGDRSLT